MDIDNTPGIVKDIVALSHLTPEELETGIADPEMEHIFQAFLMIHKGKQALYGNYIDTHGSKPTQRALIQHWCDMERKYTRANNIIDKMSSGEMPFDANRMIECYTDIAIYATIGVQLVYHLQHREQRGEKK